MPYKQYSFISKKIYIYYIYACILYFYMYHYMYNAYYMYIDGFTNLEKKDNADAGQLQPRLKKKKKFIW